MKTTVSRNLSSWMLALFGVLFLNLSAFATEPGGMMKDGKPGEMMQSEQMSADEMIKKGDEMIAQGKEMKKKGMMMKKKEMKNQGTMQQDKMMKENEMKENQMNEMNK